jgi:hypothetical protein
MAINNYFDTKKPIITSFIEECDGGEFKLSDAKFNQALREYGMNPDDEKEVESVMSQMLECTAGEFVRVSDGWLFLKK